MYRKFLSLFIVLLFVATACASTDEGAKKDTPAKAGQTVGSTTRTVVDTTKEVAVEIGHGTKEAGKSVWGAMKSFGKSVKKGWKEGIDGDSGLEAPSEPEEDVEH